MYYIALVGDDKVWPLLEGRKYTIGRERNCDIVLPDHKKVSRHHARVAVRNGLCYVDDMGSENGTHLGDRDLRQIGEAVWGDETLSIYPCELRLVSEDQGARQIAHPIIVYQVDGTRRPVDFNAYFDVTIGRADDNDIVIKDPEVSRYHARVEGTGAGYRVVDLESENGVHIDERHFRGDSIHWPPGEILTVGSVHILLNVLGNRLPDVEIEQVILTPGKNVVKVTPGQNIAIPFKIRLKQGRERDLFRIELYGLPRGWKCKSVESEQLDDAIKSEDSLSLNLQFEGDVSDTRVGVYPLKLRAIGLDNPATRGNHVGAAALELIVEPVTELVDEFDRTDTKLGQTKTLKLMNAGNHYLDLDLRLSAANRDLDFVPAQLPRLALKPRQEIAVTFYPRFSRRLPLLYTRRLFDRKLEKKHSIYLTIQDRHADAEAKPYLEHEFNATSTGIIPKTRPRRIIMVLLALAVFLLYWFRPQVEVRTVLPPRDASPLSANGECPVIDPMGAMAESQGVTVTKEVNSTVYISVTTRYASQLEFKIGEISICKKSSPVTTAIYPLTNKFNGEEDEMHIQVYASNPFGKLPIPWILEHVCCWQKMAQAPLKLAEPEVKIADFCIQVLTEGGNAIPRKNCMNDEPLDLLIGESGKLRFEFEVANNQSPSSAKISYGESNSINFDNLTHAPFQLLLDEMPKISGDYVYLLTVENPDGVTDTKDITITVAMPLLTVNEEGLYLLTGNTCKHTKQLDEPILVGETFQILGRPQKNDKWFYVRTKGGQGADVGWIGFVTCNFLNGQEIPKPGILTPSVQLDELSKMVEPPQSSSPPANTATPVPPTDTPEPTATPTPVPPTPIPTRFFIAPKAAYCNPQKPNGKGPIFGTVYIAQQRTANILVALGENQTDSLYITRTADGSWLGSFWFAQGIETPIKKTRYVWIVDKDTNKAISRPVEISTQFISSNCSQAIIDFDTP
ncbi:MAG: FHA domain-containing protein [Caldilineaceae bacterium]